MMSCLDGWSWGTESLSCELRGCNARLVERRRQRCASDTSFDLRSSVLTSKTISFVYSLYAWHYVAPSEYGYEEVDLCVELAAFSSSAS